VSTQPQGGKGEHSAAGKAGDAVWAVIPARYASTRFPGKPLVAIAGKPMIQHTYERTASTPGIARVLVATDDTRIADAVAAFGGEAVRTGDHPTGTDRIAEAVRLEVAAGAAAPGWVLNVQGDEPLIDPGDLETLVRGMRAHPDCPMGTLIHPLSGLEEFRDPNVVKVALDTSGRALYFSRAAIPHPRDQEGPGAHGWRHLGVYMYRLDFLERFGALPPTPLSALEQLEQLRALEHGYEIRCFEAKAMGVGVDVPADVARVEKLLGISPDRKGQSGPQKPE